SNEMTTPKTFLEHVGASPPTVSPSACDSILVIIDSQDEYLDGLLSKSKDNIAYSRPNILKLLQHHRTAHVPVTHVVHVVGSGSPMFTPDTSLTEILPELDPLLDRVGSGKQDDIAFEVLVRKHFPGAFAETTLNAVIKQAGVRKVL
ncbi:Isochorismatase-like protein, partial [Favolaschia claudopus]